MYFFQAHLSRALIRKEIDPVVAHYQARCIVAFQAAGANDGWAETDDSGGVICNSAPQSNTLSLTFEAPADDESASTCVATVNVGGSVQNYT